MSKLSVVATVAIGKAFFIMVVIAAAGKDAPTQVEVPMKISRKWPSNDKTFLTVVMGLLAALTTLALFQSPPERVPSIEMLKAAIDRFRQYLEGSKNFDRVQIALRKKARAEVIALFDKVFHFLESVADEDDALKLQEAGFELCKPYSRKKTSKKTPAAEQEGVMIAGGLTGG